MKKNLLALLFALSLVGSSFSSPATAAGIAGKPCAMKQLNSKVILGDYQYTCILWKNKFVWSNGNKIKLIQPATKSPTPTATPTSTPSKSNLTWSQVSPVTIKGTASPGEILTVQGGEWTGPSTPKIIYYWHHCSGGQTQDIASAFSAPPEYVQGMTQVRLRPGMYCGFPPGITSGTSYKVPENLGITTFITVSQFVWINEKLTGFGYYSYARGVPVTTKGVIGAVPHVNANTVRICADQCSLNRSGYTKYLGSNVGQWKDPNKSIGQSTIFPVRSWYLCSTANSSVLNNLPSDCTLSPRSTPADLYEITAADSGKHIRVCATASNSVGTRTQCSGTYEVGIPVSNIEAPRLQGLNRVGSTLTLSRGIWAGSPTPEVTVAWYSCDANGYAAAVNNPRLVNDQRLDSTTTNYENRSPYVGCLFRQFGKELLSYTIKPEDSLRIMTVLITASNGYNREGYRNGDYMSYYLSMNQPSN